MRAETRTRSTVGDPARNAVLKATGRPTQQESQAQSNTARPLSWWFAQMKAAVNEAPTQPKSKE